MHLPSRLAGRRDEVTLVGVHLGEDREGLGLGLGLGLE